MVLLKRKSHPGRCRYTHTYSGISRHIKYKQTYLQAYNPSIVRPLVYSVPEAYSESWYIQNPDIIRMLAYLEPCSIRNPGIFRTLSSIYDGAFSRKQLTAIIIFITSAVQVLYFMKKSRELEQVRTFFNTGLIFIPEVFILCKVRDREFMNREFIQINQHIWS